MAVKKSEKPKKTHREELFACVDEDWDSVLMDRFFDAVSADQWNPKEESEKKYLEITDDIVSSSIELLERQYEEKQSPKKIFMWFFIVFLSIQYAVLLSLLYIKTFAENIGLTDTVIISYISSVFVETLGAIIYMVKYSFNTEQETTIVGILHGVVEKFQKYKE